MIVCTKCGNNADSVDSVCPVCGGFLAGNHDPVTLTVGASDGESDFLAISDEVGEPVDGAWQNSWPLVSRVLIIVLYAVFVLAVAVAVNWMLRKL